MKIIIFLFALFFLFDTHSAYSSDLDVPCISGNCEGWNVYIESGFSNEPSTIFAMNETGEVAYKVKVTVDFFDQFDDHLGRAVFGNPGPIRERVPFTFKMHPKVYRAECIVTWSKEPD